VILGDVRRPDDGKPFRVEGDPDQVEFFRGDFGDLGPVRLVVVC
jgi:hypothetical protein